MKLDGLRILVVEDEPVVAMCLEDILDGLGCFTVGPASRLADGLRLAEATALDAAILDINLAGERSTDIARALSRRGVPFVFASGYGTPPEEFSGTTLIAKPYREIDVERALASVL